MPVYMEPIKREALIKSIERGAEEKIKTICIIGCGACANTSCSLYRNEKEPAMSLFMKPLAMEREMDRLKIRLGNKYETVDAVTLFGLCDDSRKKEKTLKPINNSADKVVILSCPAGYKTVERYIDEEKMVIGMQLKGFKSVRTKFTLNGIYVKE